MKKGRRVCDGCASWRAPPDYALSTSFRGRPPLSPFARDALALALLLRRPLRAAMTLAAIAIIAATFGKRPALAGITN